MIRRDWFGTRGQLHALANVPSPMSSLGLERDVVERTGGWIVHRTQSRFNPSSILHSYSMFVEQHRMHPELSAVISETAYQERLMDAIFVRDSHVDPHTQQLRENIRALNQQYLHNISLSMFICLSTSTMTPSVLINSPIGSSSTSSIFSELYRTLSIFFRPTKSEQISCWYWFHISHNISTILKFSPISSWKVATFLFARSMTFKVESMTLSTSFLQ